MELLYIQVAPPSFPLPVEYTPTTFIVIADKEVVVDWRFRLSRWLIESGCLLMLAWGVECSRWDDAVDEAHIMFWGGESPDEQFVLTTWHDNEPLDKVMHFAKYGLRHAHTPSTRTVLLHICDVADEDGLLARYANA